MKAAGLIFIFFLSKASAGLYPYGQSAGDAAAPKEDDGCHYSYKFPISMFGKLFTKLYVCTNGLISLDRKYIQWTTRPFPMDASEKATLICPYWADVDLTVGGDVWSRTSKDPVLLAQASHDVVRAFPTQAGFNATKLLIATWDEVYAYGNDQSGGNTFQAVIVSDGVTAFAIFNYKKILWVQGAAVDSRPAQVGFDAGNGKNCYSTPSSRLPQVLNISTETNVGVPGTMMFMLGSANTATIFLPGKIDPTTKGAPRPRSTRRTTLVPTTGPTTSLFTTTATTSAPNTNTTTPAPTTTTSTTPAPTTTTTTPVPTTTTSTTPASTTTTTTPKNNVERKKFSVIAMDD